MVPQAITLEKKKKERNEAVCEELQPLREHQLTMSRDLWKNRASS